MAVFWRVLEGFYLLWESFSEAVMSFGVLLHSRFGSRAASMAFFYIPGLVHALLQSNNVRVAYIDSLSRLSV
jgi:hypothetical protein